MLRGREAYCANDEHHPQTQNPEVTVLEELEGAAFLRLLYGHDGDADRIRREAVGIIHALSPEKWFLFGSVCYSFGVRVYGLCVLGRTVHHRLVRAEDHSGDNMDEARHDS